MRRIRLLVPLLSFFFCACSTERGEIWTPVEKTPDLTFEEVGLKTVFYDATNPHTVDVLRARGERAGIRAEIERFEAEGYAYSAPHSFVAEGVSPDGRRVEIAVLTLGHADARREDAVYLFSIRVHETFATVPLRFSFAKTSADGERIDDGVSPLRPLAASGALPGDPELAWNWRRWGRCVGAATVGGATGCVFGCRVALVGYLKCLAICSAGRALGGLVGCTFTELF